MDAVVIGAGIAGLAAARVLAHRADHITIFERDPLPDQPGDRPGVPQGHHPHALLVAGNDALERLFPGLTDELADHGAVKADAAQDIAFWQLGAFRTRFHSGIPVVSATRALLEFLIRRRVKKQKNVSLMSGTPIRRLTGVRAHRVHGVETTDGRNLRADLVIDATGRAGSGGWLRSLGLPSPAQQLVRVDVGYATRLLRREPGQLDGLLLAGVADTPPRPRFGVAFAVDGGRWQVTLGGWHGDHAPADPTAYREFAASLPDPLIAHLLDAAEPLTDVRSHTFPASHRRYYERLPDPPEGYVAIGDALCAVNPIYGQGMTMAVLEAIELAKADGDIAAYYRAAARIVDTPWRIATGADFQFPQTAGRRPPGLTIFNRYVRRVVLGTHVSNELHRRMLRVQHLLEPPSALMRPATVACAVWHSRRSPAA
jgi:flavin-dependent dehydrogenase